MPSTPPPSAGRLSLARSGRAGGRWDAAVPPLLRPLLRAYLLGYASAVGPRLLTLALQHLSIFHRRRKDTAVLQKPGHKPFLESLRLILRSGLEWQRFPTFCAALIGGSTLLQVPLKRLLDRLVKSLSDVSRQRLSRWFAAFIAAWLSVQLLQSKHSAAYTETIPTKSDSPPGVNTRTIKFAGRTLDLSLFAATRALDVIVGELWSRRRARRVAQGKWTAAETFISRLTDPALFALSSGLIMWTWIYLPEALPRSYNKWIGSAAAVDVRLLGALRRCRSGELQYGEDTGQAHVLQPMCADYRWPMEWGDPAVSVPFPCEMVHMGAGPNCEHHALSRFARSFRWSMATYLPLNLLLLARKPNLKRLRYALISSARSSAFLATFITLFYYGVCLARTRVGPRILGTGVAARQRIDSGLCVGTGCALCGWSILIENAGRRKDMALFVAPRALATLLPRRYSLEKQWRETLIFAASTAVVFTCVLENRKRVRGVLGNLLETVLTP